MARLPVQKKKMKQYRKQHLGESGSITEEMRFIVIRLCNIKGKKLTSSNGFYTGIDTKNTQSEDEEGSRADSKTEKNNENSGDREAETWTPSMEGFLKYLVDSKLIFNTLERIVDESDDVACEYFFLAISLQRWVLFIGEVPNIGAFIESEINGD
ncbi:hypothetical protein V6N13_100353 [Hibiscus sabdariffa]